MFVRGSAVLALGLAVSILAAVTAAPLEETTPAGTQYLLAPSAPTALCYFLVIPASPNLSLAHPAPPFTLDAAAATAVGKLQLHTTPISLEHDYLCDGCSCAGLLG